MSMVAEGMGDPARGGRRLQRVGDFFPAGPVYAAPVIGNNWAARVTGAPFWLST